ncbi:hypothetical protein [Burkholderia ubonensis]|uniref:Uncharacterized protein n=1 Tax=Burkholderia ubonensis TaxID=101571 RepID=A0A108JQU4_9BURK|nr:hypothetical protein [Burkholderia ubonensis]AOK58924.1 hypothetical protein WM29_07185 [Burkholderia ubonensis]KVS36202.1 hypothetical protein WK37_32870 [Burkholderia ubonensis]KVS49654.1 hypothetical protein WK38_16100 [Burkholderia ubonensis]KVS72499.1 hypothetical protein WK42_23445 [Burkholderia ubonensis]KVS78915.1 hypothetical protein WK43_29770 [Burkholderia ubonensis]
MKPMSLLAACGIVVSLALALPAHADDHARQPRRQQEHKGNLHVPPGAEQPNQSVPRGDLRGDIASNARARVGLPPQDSRRRP